MAGLFLLLLKIGACRNRVRMRVDSFRRSFLLRAKWKRKSVGWKCQQIKQNLISHGMKKRSRDEYRAAYLTLRLFSIPYRFATYLSSKAIPCPLSFLLYGFHDIVL
jgi:hypothetical protein